MGSVILLLLLGCALAAAAVHPKDAAGNSFAKTFHDRLQELDLLQDVPRARHTEEMLPHAMRAYSATGQPPADQLHTLTFALKPKSISVLKALLDDISDPNSDSYGYVYQKADLDEITQFSLARTPVLHYLAQAGVTTHSIGNGGFIEATARIDVWEPLLQCTFFIYQSNADPSVQLVRTRSYSLDASLSPYVLAVFGATHMPDPHSRPFSSNGDDDSSSSSPPVHTTTPAFLASLYNFSLYNNDTKPPPSIPLSEAPSQTLLGLFDQSFLPTDLAQFQSTHHLPRAIVLHKNLSTSFSSSSSSSSSSSCPRQRCGESTLGLAYLLAVCPHCATTFSQSPSPSDWLVGWLAGLLTNEGREEEGSTSGGVSLPAVLLLPSGMDEAFVSPTYADTFNLLALLLSLRGTTLLAAAGDDGAVGQAARHNAFFCSYRVSFPASSPYVLAVGGSNYQVDSQRETACESGRNATTTSSPGGFSTLHRRPAYQDAAITDYLSQAFGEETREKPSPGFVRDGRGVPDVSLLATQYEVVLDGQAHTLSGTSAAAAVLAGLISRINTLRLQQGKNTVGWINPFLYQKASLFARDITTGQNHCAAWGLTCCAQGFFAREGWDPVTGWGSLDFGNLASALLALARSGDRPVLPEEPDPQTASASPSPSSSPSPAAGWVSLRQYEEEGCQGDVSYVTSVRTGLCMPLYLQGTLQGSIQFLCEKTENPEKTETGSSTSTSTSSEESRIRVRRFRDDSCSESLLYTESHAGTGCAYHAQNYYYSSASTFSVEVLCSETAAVGAGKGAVPDLVEYSDARYSQHRGYVSPKGCEESKVSSVDAFLQGVCLSNLEQKISFRYTSEGVRQVFAGEQCDDDDPSSILEEVPLPRICTLSPDWTTALPFYNYYYGENQDQGIGRLGTWERWTVPALPELFSDPPTELPTELSAHPTELSTVGPTTAGFPTQGTIPSQDEQQGIWRSGDLVVYGGVGMLIIVLGLVCCVRKDLLCGGGGDAREEAGRYGGMQRLPTEDDDDDEEEGIALNPVRH